MERLRRTDRASGGDGPVVRRAAAPGPSQSAVPESRLVGALAHGLPALRSSLGNQLVMRLLRAAQRGGPSRGGSGPPIQRYAVNVAGDADCQDLLDWMNSSNPYAAEGAWAKTVPTFNWSSDGIQVLPAEGEENTYTVRILNPRVTVSSAVDMPQWTAGDPAMQPAWDTMWSALRAHEAEHEARAEEWKTTLRDRLAAVRLTVTADSAQAALDDATSQINTSWGEWLGDHQDAQRELDPYTATFTCPHTTEDEAPDEEPPAESAPEGGAPESVSPVPA